MKRIFQYFFLLFVGLFVLVGSAQAQIKFERTWPVGGVSGIDLDSQNNAYVSSGYQIISFTPSGEEIRRWGGLGIANGQFDCIGASGIAVDRTDGLIYATDCLLGRIQKFFLDGRFIQKWGTRGVGAGQLDRPQGIAVAPDGSIYTAEDGNDRVQHFGDTGSSLNLWGSRGYDEDQFDNPTAIATGPNGHVFVGDEAGFIREFGASGNFVKRFGGQDPTAIDGLDDGLFGSPWGAYALAVDSAGLIYAVDRDYDRIQVFRPNGTFLTKFGTTGSGALQFDAPVDIAIGTNDLVYVAERNNNRVQVFSTAGSSPANDFAFGKKTTNLKRGTVTLRIRVPGAGQVQLLGSSRNRSDATRSRGKTTVRLKVRAKGRALRTLRQTKRVTIQVRVRFIPSGGVPRTKKTQATLRLR